MKSETSVSHLLNRQQQAYQYFLQGDYPQAIALYEQAISAEPDVKKHHWNLGLTLLMQGQEVEAQTTWFLALAESEPEQVEKGTAELTQILSTEAERQTSLVHYKVAWIIRQHIGEINPGHLDNLLHTIRLSPNIKIEDEATLPLQQGAQLLRVHQLVKPEPDLLLQALHIVLENHPLHPFAFDFVEACALNIPDTQHLLKTIDNKAIKFLLSLSSEQAARFADLFLRSAPNDLATLAKLTNLYQNSGRYLESLEFCQRMLDVPHKLADEITAYYLITRGFMRAGGHWQQAELAYRNYQKVLNTLIASRPDVERYHLINLMLTVSWGSYLQDTPEANHTFRNNVARFYQSAIQKLSTKGTALCQPQTAIKHRVKPAKSLKIGYLSTCLRRHSISWLCRWIFQHHNADKFKIHAYSLRQTGDHLQEFIAQHASHFCDLSPEDTVSQIAERIYQDEIDILIDLDSVTSGDVCAVMALKPAPIQVTWLGSDASGLPGIDYFIADPYVLPKSAQEYYASTIWRLPQTYIAVDGFEVSIPTLRREQLGIPNDAIVYLSCQIALKRNPNTSRLQVKILKEVPGSYLLIKGQSDPDSIKRFFEQIAEEEGVSCDRLRFLSDVPSEAIHRANLGIADVVLDTYPYNGATTTLETLWREIPLVTRVGEQFAARNSYTMMMNVGITEGIAWTDEEYVEWGIRLGKEPELRQQISWRLRQSKRTSPLWNAEQFTREMEKAYEQMWQRYVEAG
ncbi:MAG: tetratricopeptide repeat protein [Cyanothece sp. SIO1E1]|nr:tetratricopeptide repeat protein [Cyanothece sp. SIO1E1]